MQFFTTLTCIALVITCISRDCGRGLPQVGLARGVFYPLDHLSEEENRTVKSLTFNGTLNQTTKSKSTSRPNAHRSTTRHISGLPTTDHSLHLPLHSISRSHGCLQGPRQACQGDPSPGPNRYAKLPGRPIVCVSMAKLTVWK